MGIIINAIRWFIWGIIYAVFSIGDAIYGVTVQVASLNVGELQDVWDYWSVLSVLIGTIAFFRVMMMVLKYYMDEQYQEKVDLFKIFGGVLMVSLAMGLMPQGIKFITGAGETFINNIHVVTGTQSDMVPSTLIISSVMGQTFEVKGEDGNYVVPKNYKLSDVDINVEVDDEYTYFPETGDLFVLLIMGGISAVGLLLIGLEIAERFFKLAIKILISPIPISGLVNPEDEGFTKWVRLVIADVVLNCIQLLSLLFILSVCSSTFIRSKGVWVTLIMFVGGIFTILKGTPEISSLIGGDTSTQGTLQQIASIRQATAGMGNAIGNVGGKVGGVAGNAAAVAGYGLGRAIGGRSMSDLSNQRQDSTKSHNSFRSSGQSPRNDNHNDINRSGGGMYQSTFDGQSQSDDMSMSNTNTQIDSGSYIDPNAGGTNDAYAGNEQSYQSAQQNTGFSNSERRRQNSSDDGYSNSNQQSNAYQQDQGNYEGLAKPGTPASNFAQKAYSNKGSKFARMGSNAGRHVYQSSMNRLQQTLPARASMMLSKASAVPKNYPNQGGDQ